MEGWNLEGSETMEPKRVRLTDKVRRGLWLICARSPTVMDAEAGPEDWEPHDREAVLLAMAYACQNFKPPVRLDAGRGAL